MRTIAPQKIKLIINPLLCVTIIACSFADRFGRFPSQMQAGGNLDAGRICFSAISPFFLQILLFFGGRQTGTRTFVFEKQGVGYPPPSTKAPIVRRTEPAGGTCPD